MTTYKANTLLHNRYRIEGLLNPNDAAAPYLAIDQENNSKVLLYPTEQSAADFTQRTAALMRRLHPSLPQVLDHFTLPEGGAHVLVVEHVPGPTLAERVTDQGPLNNTAAESLLEALLSALDYLHNRQPNVVHGAVAPTQIVLPLGGDPVLIGYHLSPPSDPTADLQGLAATLYFALSGKPPASPPQPLRRVAPRAPAGLASVIDQALAGEFQRVAQFQMALGESAPTAPSATAASPPPKAAPPPPKPEPVTLPAPTPAPRRVVAGARPNLPTTKPSGRLPIWLGWGAALLLIVAVLAGGAWLAGQLWSTAAQPALTANTTNSPSPTANISPTTAAVAVVNSAVPSATPSPTRTTQPSATPTQTPPTPSPTATATLPTETATVPPPSETPVLPTEFPAGAVRVAAIDDMPLVYVPSGEFTFGSNPNIDTNTEDSERPQLTLNLSGFWIDQHEVTNEQYFRCILDGVCTRPQFFNSSTHENYFTNPDYNNYPVLYVRWAQANAYCLWANRQLPSEPQWEKAARSSDSRLYPWGNTLPNELLANYAAQSGDVQPVGSYPTGVSPYGALDMAGNVAEWVSNYYRTNYFGFEAFLEAPPDPATLFLGGVNTIRNGAWNSAPDQLRSAARRYAPATDYSSPTVGFRCVSLSPPD